MPKDSDNSGFRNGRWWTMDERTKLEAYRKELIQRLDACTQKPQYQLEYWLNEDDVAWLMSLNIILEQQ
jgi:hypothetical protein